MTSASLSVACTLKTATLLSIFGKGMAIILSKFIESLNQKQTGFGLNLLNLLWSRNLPPVILSQSPIVKMSLASKTTKDSEISSMYHQRVGAAVQRPQYLHSIVSIHLNFHIIPQVSTNSWWKFIPLFPGLLKCLAISRTYYINNIMWNPVLK